MTTAMKVRKVLIPATEQIDSHTVCGRVCDHSNLYVYDNVLFADRLFKNPM